MSSVALQRVVVRMLFDPKFVSAVHSNVRAALADCELERAEMEWIAAADRRAFGIDPYRASRALHALIEEFPLASAIVLRMRNGLTLLQSFFSHPVFHQGMQRGASLASLYAEYLAQRVKAKQPAFGAALELESALARARRHRSSPGDRWQFADGVGLLLDARLEPEDYARTLRSLGEPAERLHEILDAKRKLQLPQPVECFPMLLRAEPEIELERVNEELAAVLAVAHHGALETHWRSLATLLDVEMAELRELLADLAADRILRAPEEA